MAETATGSLTVAVAGDGDTGSFTYAIPSNAAAAPPSTFLLANGANTILLPTGYTVNGVMVKPPNGSVVTKTSKGIAGDTGIPRQPAYAWVETFAAGTVSFVITAGGAETLRLIWF